MKTRLANERETLTECYCSARLWIVIIWITLKKILFLDWRVEFAPQQKLKSDTCDSEETCEKRKNLKDTQLYLFFFKKHTLLF